MADSWYSALLRSIREQTGTWFVAAVIAILTVFSNRIVESIKFALNRADLRSSYYEKLSEDLSEFVFRAELNAEFIGKGWTTRESMTDLIKDYNASIVKLRRMEYAYAAWIAKYWGAKQVAEFEEVMGAVKAFDRALHGLNDQFELVNIKKTQDKVDPGRASETAAQMTPLLKDLSERTNAMLVNLR